MEKFIKYNKSMFTSHFEYSSPNGIYYHHSQTVTSDGRHASYRPDSHRLIEVLLLLSGNVEYSIDGSIYRINPGDCIIVNAQELHSLKINENIPYERIMLQFSPTFIPKINDVDLSTPFVNAHLYQHIIPRKLVKESRIESILKDIKTLCRDTTKFRDPKIISRIVDLILEINLTVENLLTVEYQLIPTPKSTNELLQSIIKYISENITKNISTKDICTFLGISDSYLYRFFKNNMGISLHQYMQNQKMQLAHTMINQGYLPQNVSNYLGYEYYATFFAQFKKQFGKSPKAVINKVPTPPRAEK